jgi:hypothetical protein
VPGRTNANTGLLTALNFSWDGITYNQTTANTGFLEFDTTGALTEDLFGNNCLPGSCGVVSPFERWFVGFPAGTGLIGFANAVAGDSEGFGTVTHSLVTARPSLRPWHRLPPASRCWPWRGPREAAWKLRTRRLPWNTPASGHNRARAPLERVWVWQYRPILPPDLFDKMGRLRLRLQQVQNGTGLCPGG